MAAWNVLRRTVRIAAIEHFQFHYPLIRHQSFLTQIADDKKILFLSYTVRCDNHSFRKSLSLVKKNFAVYIRDRLRTQDRTLIHERSRAIYESINSSHRDFLTDIRVRREKRRRCKKKKKKKKNKRWWEHPFPSLSFFNVESDGSQTRRRRYKFTCPAEACNPG